MEAAVNGNDAITATITALAVTVFLVLRLRLSAVLQAELRAAQQRNGEMRVKLQAANQRSAELQANAIKRLRFITAECDNNAEMERMLEQAREELQEVRSSMHVCEEQVLVKERHIMNLKQEIATRNSIQVMQLEEATTMGHTLTEVNKELDAVKAELVEANAKKEEAMTDNQRLLEELIRLDDHPDMLRKARNDLAASESSGQKALADERQSSSFQLSSLQAENEQLKREIVDLLVVAEENKSLERANMERMVSVEDQLRALEQVRDELQQSLAAKDLELLKLPELQTALKESIERHEAAQLALADLEEKKSLVEQTKVGMVLQLEQKEFHNKQLQLTLDDTIHVSAAKVRAQAKEHGIYQFRHVIRRIRNHEARQAIIQWREEWRDGKVQDQKRVIISKNSEIMASHNKQMQDFIQDKNEFVAENDANRKKLEKELEKQQFHNERLLEQLQLLREQIATRAEDADAHIAKVQLRNRETLMLVAMHMMRQVAGRLKHSAVRLRLELWSVGARFHKARMEGLDREALRDANATVNNQLQQMLDTNVSLTATVQKAAILMTRRGVGRIQQRRVAACWSTMCHCFKEYLLSCANELSMRQALDIEQAAFHNDQLDAALREQVANLKKEQDAVARQGLFNKVLQESLHENLQSSAQNTEQMRDAFDHEKLTVEKRGALRLFRLNRNVVMWYDIQKRFATWRERVAADRIWELDIELTSHKRQQEVYALHANDLSETLNARLAEIHECQGTIAQLRRDLATERSLNDMAQSRNPNAQLQKKIDDMQLELAAVRSEASRTQKILHLTKEDLAQAQEELLYKSKTTPAQMPTFGQDVEMHSEKSQNPGVEWELALAREQIASLTQEGEKSKQMIKDLLRDVDALTRKSSEPKAYSGLPAETVVDKKVQESTGSSGELASVQEELRRKDAKLRDVQRELFAAQTRIMDQGTNSPASTVELEDREDVAKLKKQCRELHMELQTAQMEMIEKRNQKEMHDEVVRERTEENLRLRQQLKQAQSRLESESILSQSRLAQLEGELASRKQDKEDFKLDCVSCEEHRAEIAELKAKLAQMEHHSKTNARFALQIETIQEENRKLTSELASKEAVLIEQRTARLRKANNESSPPGSSYKRTPASQARTKRPGFAAPG